jgi:hypothetical protein
MKKIVTLALAAVLLIAAPAVQAQAATKNPCAYTDTNGSLISDSSYSHDAQAAALAKVVASFPHSCKITAQVGQVNSTRISTQLIVTDAKTNYIIQQTAKGFTTIIGGTGVWSTYELRSLTVAEATTIIAANKH